MLVMFKRFRFYWKISFSLLALIFISNTAFAGNEPSILDLIRDNMENGNHLGVLTQLQANKAIYSNSSSRLPYFDNLACYESFLGINKKSLKHDDISESIKSDQGTFDIEKYKIKDAKDIIINASKTHQVIFINEAHHVPQHRAFTLSLLQNLYDQGYRYFAAEALGATDTELNQRGYPLSKKTGYLTDEPMYGELIRVAQKIGYHIVPYESYPECDPWHEPPEKCQNLREEGQARNLYEQIFKSDPTAKLLVHAGYGHIAKKGAEGWIPMAVYFEQITGIHPYSIDQTSMREHSNPLYENYVYRKVSKTGLIKKNSVLVQANNSPWLPSDLEGVFDLMIFQPRTTYKNNRPTWLFEIEQRKKFSIPSDICKNDFPCVVEALSQREGLDSIPVDRLIISSKKHSITLGLVPGMYIIRAKNKSGDILSLDYDVMP